MTLRGKECAGCRRVGHHRAAAAWADGPEGESEPVCLDCVNERPCLLIRAAAVRELSSVATRPEEFSAFGLDGQLPPDPPPVKAVWPAWSADASMRSTRSAARMKRDVPVRVIRGVEVRMPAESVMGAELIDLIADFAGIGGGMMTELNPNHPVTQAVHDHWHKIAALLMAKMGKRRIVIGPHEISNLEGQNITIRFDDSIGIELRLVSDEEAARLVRKEGGLPV